jgi:hypothetical protein
MVRYLLVALIIGSMALAGCQSSEPSSESGGSRLTKRADYCDLNSTDIGDK